jgi:hypothetical protein
MRRVLGGASARTRGSSSRPFTPRHTAHARLMLRDIQPTIQHPAHWQCSASLVILCAAAMQLCPAAGRRGARHRATACKSNTWRAARGSGRIISEMPLSLVQGTRRRRGGVAPAARICVTLWRSRPLNIAGAWTPSGRCRRCMLKGARRRRQAPRLARRAAALIGCAGPRRRCLTPLLLSFGAAPRSSYTAVLSTRLRASHSSDSADEQAAGVMRP